ncbi:thioredoxin domain-containing protein [Spirosoma pollinicola]|uniref:Ammonia monooxygenase n=1 Tax=Spirosoma pollinicola TaxID=2057025 RepID=A0A2K8Z352_9BACT|nr:thioredoxin domain-containing protein [Spirosoma pollinicola]AUD04269.1 ammonia monooxygenase [Spirosoma pollinicola]
MDLTKHPPILIPAKTAVLLAFLPSASRENGAVSKLVDTLQQYLGEAIKILKIDETLHPDVVQSFSVDKFPTYILVQQGIELWRHEGPSDEVNPEALSLGLSNV